MVQGRRRLRLPDKARVTLVVLKQMRGEKLEGDRAVELGVLGPIDNTHPAFAELLDDAVVRDALPNHGCAPLT